jgi:hypothetical protein
VTPGDVGHLIHSLGCTFLTAAGRDHGFAAVSEVPMPHEGPFAHVEEDVRSDSVWFDRTTKRVTLLAEFERYAGKKKDLRPKALRKLFSAGSPRAGYGNVALFLTLGDSNL